MNVGKLEVSAESALSFIRRRRDRVIVFRRFRQCDVLVIDEMSQLHPKVLNNLEQLAKIERKSEVHSEGSKSCFVAFF